MLAALSPHLTDERRERIEQVLGNRLGRLTVVVENLHDPHNGAAAVRSAEAVGLQDFHAICEREPFRMARGITMQCERWMDLHLHGQREDGYRRLRELGFGIYVADPGAGMTVEELPSDRPMALVFGSERDGLTKEAIRESDGGFAIPMHGFTGNFNLSVSVALSVHRVAERVRAWLGRPGDLPSERVERLRALWYGLSVRAAEQILRRWQP
jgi:tRNA (guanosine-2'-O-)-methyltransferase